MPADADRSPDDVVRAEVAVATHVLGSQIGVDIVRFMARHGDTTRGVYWRDIANALPTYAESSLRRQIAELEDAGVLSVEVPEGFERGGRRGVTVKYIYNPARLDELLTFTKLWLSGQAAADDEPIVTLRKPAREES
ncbi:hypothetical protein GSU68_19195 (plasmid) [Rathayibacter sp. VKM Ac-2759]|uniref:hypothetical protein n=1 Tax=Rathayibacter sp. VKM Ac-2759 TaxID=2609252 RepID=UPI0013198662|nr:hypothetical protein [Rathayibacter sp. VKM Ac-2759]QHC68845.1 hypothetical protein GSU68_19195 [Rathayibacter sp. VKM Ac-2759]